jgi:hypothetical protein
MNRAGRFRAKVGKEFKAWNERKRFSSFAIFADLCAKPFLLPPPRAGLLTGDLRSYQL